MEVQTFVLTVKHDNGTVKIRTAATSEDAAREIVIRAEGCPPWAIIRVRKMIKKSKIQTQ